MVRYRYDDKILVYRLSCFDCDSGSYLILRRRIVKNLTRPDKNSLKVYLPTDKTDKTRVRGFWKGSSGLCYDYIRQIRVGADSLPHLKKRYKQDCLFYTRQGKAYIWYNKNKIEELRRCIYFSYDRYTRGLKTFLQDILKTYGGFTIYIREANYLVEVWQ